jgi:hypothetical protein
VASKLFFYTFSAFFLEKYQHLNKAFLAQSLPVVEFYHWLKYLHNVQSHPVYERVLVIFEKMLCWHIFDFSNMSELFSFHKVL